MDAAMQEELIDRVKMLQSATAAGTPRSLAL